ncbi:MAG TPA: hypothetical protein VKI20_03125, partial [Acidimicrobiales bacterium]|nr:hypothetical protein [Acidimicrobiales bacterium]
MSTMLAGTPGGPFGQTTSVLSAEAAAGRAVPTGAVVVVAATAAAAEAAVVRAGGHVEAPLPLARAVAARIGRSTAARLATAAVKVLPDIRIPVSSGGFGTGNATFDAQISAINPGPGWSLDSGAGVGVALVDTGVADTPDLAGHVVRGPDFSADGQDEGDHQDGRGDGRDEYG